MADSYVPVECVPVHMTQKAVQVVLTDDPRDHVWIPFSVIFEDDVAEMEIGEVVEINVKEWFASKEAL